MSLLCCMAAYRRRMVRKLGVRKLPKTVPVLLRPSSPTVCHPPPMRMGLKMRRANQGIRIGRASWVVSALDSNHPESGGALEASRDQLPLHLSSDPSSPQVRRSSSPRIQRSSICCRRGIRSCCCSRGPAHTCPPRAIGLTCDLYVWGQDKILGALLLVYGVLVVNRGPLSQQHRNILISNFSIRMTDLHVQYTFRQQGKQHTLVFDLSKVRTLSCSRQQSSCSRHAVVMLACTFFAALPRFVVAFCAGRAWRCAKGFS
jgi:hypothetical protein